MKRERMTAAKLMRRSFCEEMRAYIVVPFGFSLVDLSLPCPLYCSETGAYRSNTPGVIMEVTVLNGIVRRVNDPSEPIESQYHGVIPVVARGWPPKETISNRRI